MRRAQPRRRGTVLVLFVLLAFGLMGLAAVVLDVGLARLSQRQLQSAADAAALEGVRWRDERTDEQRRQAALELARLSFEGTGTPRLELTGGVGDLNALQTLAGAGLLDPTAALQLNLDNAPHGDLVVGNYFDTGNQDYDPATPRDENAAYQRRDFVPAQDGTAVLARLRRTNDFQGLDRVDGVSSSGPPLPLLFGRGSTIQAADPSAGYSPRHHGLSVRATAIADARPVLTVGRHDAALSLPGVTPFALSRATWNALGAGTVSVTLDGVENFFLAPPAGALTVGTALTPAAEGEVNEWTRYVPLHDTVAGQVRVVGFGHVRNATLTGTALAFEKTTAVAARNASTVPASLDAALTPDDVNALFSSTIVDPLRAPALVNRHLGAP